MIILRNRFFRWCFYFFAGIVFLSACNDPEIIGLDVQPQSDRINVTFSDTTSVIAYTVREDSLRTDETTYQLLGSYVDSVFGRSDAGIYAQVSPYSSSVDFGDTLGFDSLVLTLAYSGFYGDTTPQTFHVYQLTETMHYDSIYYSNASFHYLSKPFHYDPRELGSVTVTPSPNDSVLIDSVKRAPHLRININNTHLGDTLLAWSGQSQLSSPDTFLNHFKGLYIKADKVTAAGGIFYFNLLAGLSKMTLYYHTASTDSLKYDFIFSPFYARISHFEHNYTATPVQAQLSDSTNGTDKVYVQSLAGVKTKIRFPHFMDYIKNGMIAINKAEVEITVADSSTSHWGPPAKLLLLGIDSVGNPLFLSDQYVGSSYYGGDYNSSTRKYKFNIAHYLQNVLKGNSKDNGLYLAVSGGSIQANRAIIYGAASGTNKIKLNLFYTKPN